MKQSQYLKIAVRGVVSLGAILLSALPGCSGIGSASKVTQISVESLRDSLTANPNLLLVDVRTPEEWQAVRVQGIKKFIEHTEIAERKADFPADSATPIYLICRSGHRSTLAGDALAKLGYQRLFSVKGGTNAWVAAGFPVDSGRIPGVAP
ncbi:MAG: rhodanese-like domain-containing protein [candidate division Zixibacteria bacterium]|nr:rhodanese-like domain-containing protein [candidate division Zixibacteria bacterium]